MILFHKCPEYFQALSCYPLYSCVQPLTQNLYAASPYPQLQQLQQPQVQPSVSPSSYAPSPKAKG